jgi:CubicO group peptidase (beta-lactamase class C family)
VTTAPLDPVDSPVDAALARARALGEDGLQLCAYQDGELLVDAALAPENGDGDDARDVLYPIFSVTKAVTALSIHLQAERGALDYGDAVASHWPEFARHGKHSIRIGHVLTHRAGVPFPPAGLSADRLIDWEWIVDGVADLVPDHAPGTRNAYHSLTFGWILAEVVRRTDPARRPFGQFVRDEVCVPLGITDLWLGVPDEVLTRIARLTSAGDLPSASPETPTYRALPPEVGLVPDVFNRPEVLRACIPAVGGVADAKSVARLFALLANGGELDGVRLLSEDRVRACLRPRPDPDVVDMTYGRMLPVGMGGFWIAAPAVTERGPAILAHPGAGGSVGWADLDRRIGAAVCHNRMFGAPAEHPFAALGAAVVTSADARPAPR